MSSKTKTKKKSGKAKKSAPKKVAPPEFTLGFAIRDYNMECC